MFHGDGSYIWYNGTQAYSINEKETVFIGCYITEELVNMVEYFSVHQEDFWYLVFVVVCFVLYLLASVLYRYSETKQIEIRLKDVIYCFIFSLMSFIGLCVLVIGCLGLGIIFSIENCESKIVLHKKK